MNDGEEKPKIFHGVPAQFHYGMFTCEKCQTGFAQSLKDTTMQGGAICPICDSKEVRIGAVINGEE